MPNAMLDDLSTEISKLCPRSRYTPDTDADPVFSTRVQTSMQRPCLPARSSSVTAPCIPVCFYLMASASLLWPARGRMKRSGSKMAQICSHGYVRIVGHSNELVIQSVIIFHSFTSRAPAGDDGGHECTGGWSRHECMPVASSRFYAHPTLFSSSSPTEPIEVVVLLARVGIPRAFR